MVWFNVDDGLAFHRKALRAGNAAMGLWVRAGAECAGQLTDGFVSTLLARQLGKPAEVRALVDAELWHPAEHVDKCPECVDHGMLEVVAAAGEPGFVFHEWWLRNRSREQVERERAEARDRMQRARKKSPRSGERSDDVRANEHRTNAEVPGSDPSLYQTKPTTEPATQVPRLDAANAPPDPYAEAEHGTAQTLIAEWIDRGCDGVRPPGRVVGQVAREVGAMLTEGIPYDDVRAGLAAWHARRLSPALIASMVHETRLGPAQARPATPKPSTTDTRVRAALDLAADLEAREQATGNVVPLRQIGGSA